MGKWILIALLVYPALSLYDFRDPVDDAEHEAEHFSWELGTNDSIPETEVIYDNQGDFEFSDEKSLDEM